MRPDIRGNALAPKVECADNYEGANSRTTGLVYLGLSRLHPCGTLFQIVAVPVKRNSNGRTTPQYECLCDGRANISHSRPREEVLDMPLWGKRMKSRIQAYRRYAHNQVKDAFRHNVQANITYSNRVKQFYTRYRWTRLFNARRTLLFLVQNPTKTTLM
jgi:hypothetical protein